MTIDSRLLLYQVTDPSAMADVLGSVDRLLQLYANILTGGTVPPAALLENTLSCIPFLWLVQDADGQVLALAGLSDIQTEPKGSAFLHGLTYPTLRRYPVVNAMAAAIFRTTFETLSLQVLLAEFEADNRGALGFCRRMGFRKVQEQAPGDIPQPVKGPILTSTFHANPSAHESCGALPPQAAPANQSPMVRYQLTAAAYARRRQNGLAPAGKTDEQ